MSFGGASQFGGIGSGTMPSSIGGDPYANIDIDFSKVKTVPLPSKPFERKTEEEKVIDQKKA